MLFWNSKKKDQFFLDFKNNKKQIIKPIYTKGKLWLLAIGISNSMYVKFTHMMLKYALLVNIINIFFPIPYIIAPMAKPILKYKNMSGPMGQSRIPLRGYEVKTRRTRQSSLYELPSYLYKYTWLC